MAKRPPAASTQQHIPIAQIRDSFVIMRDGSMRAVIVVSSINFALKSQREQDSIIYQFQSFVNSLTGPVQIVVQSRQLDLNTYLTSLTEKARDQSSDLMRFQMIDYIDFISRLITLANIMEKRFFVVVPYASTSAATGGLLSSLLGGRKTAPHFTEQQFAKFQQELTDRVNVVISGLASMGLRGVQLSTQELVEFYYSIYNPEEASTEKLVGVDDLRSGVVHKEGAPS